MRGADEVFVAIATNLSKRHGTELETPGHTSCPKTVAPFPQGI